MIKSFQSTALQSLWETGKSRLDVRLRDRVMRRLDRLDVATAPEDMSLPGFDVHALKGFAPTRCTVHVNGPWCIAVAFTDGDAVAVDVGQYR